MKTLFIVMTLFFISNVRAQLIDPAICDISVVEASFDTITPKFHKVKFYLDQHATRSHKNPNIPENVVSHDHWGATYEVKPIILSKLCGDIQKQFLKKGLACTCQVFIDSYRETPRWGKTIDLVTKCKEDNPLTGEYIKRTMCSKLNRCIERLPLKSTRETFFTKLEEINSTQDFLKCGK